MDTNQVLVQRGFDAGRLRHDAYCCPPICYHDLEHPFSKVLRPDMACYVGVIHEYVKTTGAVGQLDSLVFQDLHDDHRSRNHNETSQRDIAAAEAALQGDKDRLRYTYHLAQTYREAGHHTMAIEAYLRRAAMGGWAEEVWSALYNAGRCRQAQDRFDEALALYLQAYDFRPSRAEPLYRAAEYARTKQRYQTGLMPIDCTQPYTKSGGPPGPPLAHSVVSFPAYCVMHTA
jgi:hypothetical protein